MSTSISHHQRYARSMKTYGYGHAFSLPESSEDVKPGACGYIDETGQWRPTIDLSAPLDAKYGAIGTLHKARPEPFGWGPKISETVKFSKAELETGASGLASGIPADFSIHLRFQSSTDYGAVLICTGGVLREGYHHKAPFQEWAKKNALKMAQEFPNVKEHGFYIVTTTFSADDILINTWSDKSNTIIVGLKAGVTGVGEIAPSTECYRAESASDWTHTIAEKGEAKKVVFFSGLYYKYRKLQMLRSGFEEVPFSKWGYKGTGTKFKIEDPLEDGQEYEVVLESVGI